MKHDWYAIAITAFVLPIPDGLIIEAIQENWLHAALCFSKSEEIGLMT